MTVQDFWVLSPEIAMAILALLVISVDLVTRSMAKVATVAFIGLAVPVILTLNLWFGWFGDPTSGPALFGTFEAVPAVDGGRWHNSCFGKVHS
jgi:nitric oxide reductase large subunit